MKVKLERAFPMPAAADQAWQLLQDFERVAACMPGAKITERIDARHYKGTVAVRFGPANMAFRGVVEVVALEPASRTLRLIGKGADTTGGSGASLDLTAHVEAVDNASSSLVGSSEVSMSGKAAAFGGRIADSVAEQVLRQFAANFAAELQARPVSVTVAPAGGGTTSAMPAPRPRARQLNGAALLWNAVLGWLRSLFGSRSA